MKCKECKYKEPDETRGHGEHWGTCKILEYLAKKTGKSITNAITWDNSECKIEKIIN